MGNLHRFDPPGESYTTLSDTGSDHRKPPRVPVRSAEHRHGLVVAEDPLGPGIPAEPLATQPQRDIAQVADRDRAVGDLHGSCGRPAGKHTVDEVAEVVIALVEVDL